jgi:hypothetical protein
MESFLIRASCSMYAVQGVAALVEFPFHNAVEGMSYLLLAWLAYQLHTRQLARFGPDKDAKADSPAEQGR